MANACDETRVSLDFRVVSEALFVYDDAERTTASLKEKNVKVNDIGYWKGVRGHHVFINSELGLYMDHFKGNRKLEGKSKLKDFKGAGQDIKDLDYWKKI